MKVLLHLIFSFLISARAEVAEIAPASKTPEEDRLKIEQYNQTCQLIDLLLVKKQFKVGCYSNYQHFAPTSKVSKPASGTLRIAGYNLLHPGTSKALFKDYSLMAKIINKYDVVAGMEILSTVGHDKVNDEAVVNLLKNSSQLITEMDELIAKSADARKIAELKIRLHKLKSDIQRAYSLYRGPGYFKILMALKKLDPSWALILSPRGDSALQGSVEELVGFFYRANVVNPIINPHCEEFQAEDAGTPYACIVNLSSNFMGKDYNSYFARRPFLASFRAGKMKFSLASSHVVFNFSGDEDAAKQIIKNVFDVNDVAELGGGINSSNFARFAEVKLTLNFMNRFRKKYNDDKIMLVADTNLNANNIFWPQVLKAFPGASLLIDEPTTVSPQRYLGNKAETNGVANSYDHFILDKSAFPGCDDGEVYNYYNSDIQSEIEKKYLIRFKNNSYNPISTFLVSRNENPAEQIILDGDIPPEDDKVPAQFDYPMAPDGQQKMNRVVNDFEKYLNSLWTVKKNEVIFDDFQVAERIDGLKRRVFTNQLTNAFYYRFYQELLSDHFPVSINCKNN